MSSKKKPAHGFQSIQNRKAYHDYHIEKPLQAGMVLEGWEVKAIKAGRVQLRDSHIICRKEEIWLVGCHISPLETTAHYTRPDPTRSRKLLLNKREINRLMGETQQKGFTLMPLNLHMHKGRIKCQMALAKGKKMHDKRQDQQHKDWQRDKQRLLKSHIKN